MNKILRIFFEELWSVYQWFFLFFPGRLGHYIRGFCLGVFFKSSGSWITIKENVEIYHPERLSIGERSGLGRNNVIDAFGYITIGNNVRLGPNVMIATMTHAKIGQKIGVANKEINPVVIEDNVWMGNGVTILPGVNIGEGVIVAAGAVVTKSIPSGCTVAGIPAKIIG
ncbi:acyltransferase, partial [Salinivibrio sp. IB643]|uniref:acyltransferase n=1 Tax=Salinivibrio sp. IB643 TaxID=1909445 RepID=UPI0009893587